MAVVLTPDSLAAVVGALRAAGCVFAEDEADLLTAAAVSAGDLDAMVGRRAGGEPIELIVGWAEFGGLRIAVEPGVFVPRQRTAFLAGLATELAVARGSSGVGPPPDGRGAVDPGPVVVDMCCGSGAVGAVVVAAVGTVELHAADVDPACVRCARRNLPGAAVYEGDLYAALPGSLRGRVDVLVANVPYVPTDEIGLMPPEARDYEPLVALDGGADGLDMLRRLAADAPTWLAPGGHLLVETSGRQAPDARKIMERAGLVATVTTSDELYATVVIGQLSQGSRTAR